MKGWIDIHLHDHTVTNSAPPLSELIVAELARGIFRAEISKPNCPGWDFNPKPLE